MELKDKIRNISNFPKEGIEFKDITTLIQDGEAFKESVDKIADLIREYDIDLIVGPEARGFIFGTPVAYVLNKGFAPVRKKGKLPAEVMQYEYDLEYGTDVIEIHKDAIKNGMKVAIIDDLLATGGTIHACSKLIESLGGKVVVMAFLMELEFLKGREKLEGYNVKSLIKF